MVDTQNSPITGAKLEVEYSARRETMIPVRKDELELLGSFNILTSLFLSLCIGFLFYGFASVRYISTEPNWWAQDSVFLPIIMAIIFGGFSAYFHRTGKNTVKRILASQDSK